VGSVEGGIYVTKVSHINFCLRNNLVNDPKLCFKNLSKTKKSWEFLSQHLPIFLLKIVFFRKIGKIQQQQKHEFSQCVA